MITKHANPAALSNELHAVPAGKLVRSRVLRGFTMGAGRDPADVGGTVDLTPGRTGEHAQNGWVEPLRENGALVLLDDPDYVPPVVRTVRVRWRKTGYQFRRLDGELAMTAQGEEVEILEDGHTVFTAEPDPVAEYAAAPGR